MALRSMSPRITGALVGFALLSACGSNPTALTSPSQPSPDFAIKQIPPPPSNLLPFSYFGAGFGASAFGLGCSSVLAAPLGLVPAQLIPFNLGAIGSALPYSDIGLLSTSACGIGGLGYGGFGGIGSLGCGGIAGQGFGGIGYGGIGGQGFGGVGYGGINRFGGWGQGIQQQMPIQQGAAIQQGNIGPVGNQQQVMDQGQNLGNQQQVMDQSQNLGNQQSGISQNLGNQQQVMNQDQSLGNQQSISQTSNQ